MRSFKARFIRLVHIYDGDIPSSKSYVAKYVCCMELTCRDCADAEDEPCTFLLGWCPRPRQELPCPNCFAFSRVPDKARWS